MAPTLFVFSGLPGTGKSTLARRLAAHQQAAYLRIDAIEAALVNTGLTVSVEGYAAAYALAAENLRLGLSVVADGVNPLPVTREAWAGVAAQAGARLVNVQVVCSDVTEYQRRVEARHDDEQQHVGAWRPPTWTDVQDRAYHPWNAPPLTLDTAHGTPDEQFQHLLTLLLLP